MARVTRLRAPDPAGAGNGHELYTIPEAADVLGVSRMTFYKFTRAGELPVVRVGARSVRIRRDDLERFIADRVEVGGRPPRQRRPTKGGKAS